jgi:hypothetical protein
MTIVCNEFERIWKKEVIFNLLSHYLSVRTEENHEMPRTGQWVSRQYPKQESPWCEICVLSVRPLPVTEDCGWWIGRDAGGCGRGLPSRHDDFIPLERMRERMVSLNRESWESFFRFWVTRGAGVRVLIGSRFFSSLRHLDRFWLPPSLSNDDLELFHRE